MKNQENDKNQYYRKVGIQPEEGHFGHLTHRVVF